MTVCVCVCVWYGSFEGLLPVVIYSLRGGIVCTRFAIKNKLHKFIIISLKKYAILLHVLTCFAQWKSDKRRINDPNQKRRFLCSFCVPFWHNRTLPRVGHMIFRMRSESRISAASCGSASCLAAFVVAHRARVTSLAMAAPCVGVRRGNSWTEHVSRSHRLICTCVRVVGVVSSSRTRSGCNGHVKLVVGFCGWFGCLPMCVVFFLLCFDPAWLFGSFPFYLSLSLLCCTGPVLPFSRYHFFHEGVCTKFCVKCCWVRWWAAVFCYTGSASHAFICFSILSLAICVVWKKWVCVCVCL